MQKMIYYNIYYDLIYLYMMIFINGYKYIRLSRLTIIDNDLPNIVSLVMFILWFIVEIIRIYTGYFGNIKESFPEMLIFVVISIISIALLLVNLFVPTVFALEQTLICISLILTTLEMIWE